MILSFLLSRGVRGLAARALFISAALIVASALVHELLATSVPHGH